MQIHVTRISHTISQVMDELNLSRATVYVEINNNRLRTYKIGRRRMVSHDALLEYIRAREAESVAEAKLIAAEAKAESARGAEAEKAEEGEEEEAEELAQ